MRLLTDWDALFNASTAGMLALFGVWLWTLRPRTRLTVTLGLFAVATGLAYVINNLLTGEPGDPDWDAVEFLYSGLLLLAGVALLALARVVLRAQAKPAEGLWWATVAGVAAGSVAVAASVPSNGFPFQIPYALAFAAFVLSYASLPLVFAWLYRRARPEEERARTQTMLLSVALVLWPALYGSSNVLLNIGRGSFYLGGVLVIIATAATGALWLANTTVDPSLARRARNVALLVFGLMLFGAVDNTFLAGPLAYSGSSGPFFGIARFLTIVILSYAILKHEVLGFDVRIRWGLSKSTVAAVFIAAFFLASEGAQIVLGEENQWVGLVGAGALVFAMAPLQRAAERLAERAVPVAGEAFPAPAPESRAVDTYRRAARLALRDRRLSVEEEIELAHVADGLGLSAAEATRLRHEVERDLAPGAKEVREGA